MREEEPRSIVLRCLAAELGKTEASFQTVALVGSDEHDIDLFVVLSGRRRRFVKKFLAFIQCVQKVQSRVSGYGITLSAFPTFRLEVFDKVLSPPSDVRGQRTMMQLHLLVYPTYDHFVSWEDPMIVRTICEGSHVLIGNDRELTRIVRHVGIPPLENRIGYLLSLSLENHRLLTCSLMDSQLLLREALHKALYVVRYAAFNLLLQHGCDTTDILTWQRILDNKHKFKERAFLALLDDADTWRRSASPPSKDELAQFNVQLLELLERWSLKWESPHG